MLHLRPLLLGLLGCAPLFAGGEPLPHTRQLTAEGDLSAQMVEGIDRWLDREAVRVAEVRAEKWKPDASSREAWKKSLAPKRELLRKMIGAVDARTPGALQVFADPGALAVKAESGSYTIERVRWPVFEGVHGEGLLLRPEGPARAAVIALPDADQTPEQFAGVQAGLAPEMQFARRLAEQGVLVVVMTLVDRRDEWSGNERLGRFTNQPHREWIHRQSFEIGRTLTGYEVQKVLAAVDSLRGPSAKLLADGAKIGVAGYGEGGRIALFAAALDTRLDASLVSGSFGPREGMWREPIDRNVFGLLREFGDAEISCLLADRLLAIDRSRGPELSLVSISRGGRRGAAPGKLIFYKAEEVEAEYMRSLRIMGVELPDRAEPLPRDTASAQQSLLSGLDVELRKAPLHPKLGGVDDNDARQRRIVLELQEFSQAIFRDSERTRKALPLWTKLKPGAEWDAVQKAARADFWENVIGKLPADYLPTNPRTRQIHDKEKWRGYEVMLDVHPDVFAWGTLLVPKDLKPGERRPVVVCQHGLEGLPEDTITEDQTAPAWKSYKGFASRLCERGFIVYAPHNPYRGHDKFRWLQRKANPLGLSLFSFIIAQHDVTTRWLASLPFVDGERIAFYGLSYGGKTAMRVPAVLERYCLSICSGDFNEWVLKCVSNTHPNGYVFTGEWEIWEWDLAHTFNYAEMALLIAPRPFMVERGHDDGVGLDEHVGYEWGKVRRGYDKLGISEHAEIEWFNGPHTINGVGTFKFLHKWLRWPER